MSINRPTLVLLNDCSDQMNYGAEALVKGLIRIVNAAIPDHELRTIPSHWVYDAQRGFKAFYNGDFLTQPQAIWPEVADQFECVADEWLAGRGGAGVETYLKLLEGVDAVILNGEGSMYRTNLSAVRELFIAWFAKARLEIPTVFINGLIHLTLVTPILPAMMRKTFRVLDAVTVRDPWSLKNIREFMPDIPVELIPDSALALPVDIENCNSHVKGLLKDLGKTDFFCFDPGHMPIDYRFGRRSSLYRLIAEMKQLVSQAVMIACGPYEAPMLRQLAEDTGSIYLEQQPSYHDVMAVLSRAKLQISGRFHNMVLGALVGCPAVSIGSTSHKVHGVCALLGFKEPYDGTDLWGNMESIKLQAANLLSKGAELRKQIEDNAALLAIKSYEMGIIVRNVLRKGNQGGIRPS